MTGTEPEAAPGRPRYQYWLLPFATGVAIALLLALWLFPRGDVLAAPTPTDALEAQYLALQGDEALLRQEMARLAAAVAGKKRDCRVPERPTYESRLPPDQKTEPPDDTTQPPDETQPAPDDDTAKDEPKPDEDLTIPDDAKKSGDLSFLKGCWNNTTGLFNAKTKEPVVIEYCFDANGKGRSTVIETSGRRCSAPSSARFDESGKLVIEDQDHMRCPGGGNYTKNRVDCTSEGGQAKCDGVPEKGQRWNATIRRKGGDTPSGDTDAGPAPGPSTGARGDRTRPPGPSGNNAAPPDDAPALDDAPPADDLPPPDSNTDNSTPPPADLPPVRGERMRPRR